MHDLGIVAVPSFSLEKPEETLSDSEWEQYRLHPYHG
jgi:HD-GYP domain-containing protein (c-di-GMP phosphodiesterase class II)